MSFEGTLDGVFFSSQKETQRIWLAPCVRTILAKIMQHSNLRELAGLTVSGCIGSEEAAMLRI